MKKLDGQQRQLASQPASQLLSNAMTFGNPEARSRYDQTGAGPRGRVRVDFSVERLSVCFCCPGENHERRKATKAEGGAASLLRLLALWIYHYINTLTARVQYEEQYFTRSRGFGGSCPTAYRTAHLNFTLLYFTSQVRLGF